MSNHDVFYKLLLELDIARKKRVHELLELNIELNVGEDKKYEVKAIKDKAVYAEAVEGQLLRLYNLVS